MEPPRFCLKDAMSTPPRDLPVVLPDEKHVDATVRIGGRTVGFALQEDPKRVAYRMGLELAERHSAYLPVNTNDLQGTIGVQFTDVAVKAEFEKGFYDGMRGVYREQKVAAERGHKPVWSG